MLLPSQLEHEDRDHEWYPAVDPVGNNLWLRVVNEEEGNSFTDPKIYLQQLGRALRDLEPTYPKEVLTAARDGSSISVAVRRVCRLLYTEVAVQVVFIDGDQSKDSIDISPENILEDLWTPMALIVMVKDFEFLRDALVFHSHYAHVLLHLVLKEEAEKGIKNHGTYTSLDLEHSAKDGDGAWLALVPSLSAGVHTAVWNEEVQPLMILSSSSALDQNSVVFLDEQSFPLLLVLQFVKPLLEFLVHQTREGSVRSGNLSDCIPSEVQEVLKNLRQQPNSLVLGVDAFFDACSTVTPAYLAALLEEGFGSRLLPVCFISSSSTAEALWLPYSLQDVRKYNSLAVWINGRYSALKDVASLLPKDCHRISVPPTLQRPLNGCAHLNELVLLCALLLPQCQGTEWEAVLASSGFFGGSSEQRSCSDSTSPYCELSPPVSITLLMGASVAMAAALHDQSEGGLPTGAGGEREQSAVVGSGCAMLQEKLRLLLQTSHVNEALGRYLLASPPTHMACFTELWTGPTCFSDHKKFKTRLEMLYTAMISSVLKAVVVARSNVAAPLLPPIETTPYWNDLCEWIAWSRNFFVKLEQFYRFQVHTDGCNTGGDGNSCYDQDDLSADEAFGTQNLLRFLVESIDESLEDGEAPLPRLFEWLLEKHSELAGFEALDEGRRMKMQEKNSGSQMTLETLFDKTQKKFSKRAEREADGVKLMFYGLFKQATVGDVNISKPWITDRVGRAKWFAWESVQGMSKEEAMRAYIDKYEELTR